MSPKPNPQNAGLGVAPESAPFGGGLEELIGGAAPSVAAAKSMSLKYVLNLPAGLGAAPESAPVGGGLGLEELIGGAAPSPAASQA